MKKRLLFIDSVVTKFEDYRNSWKDRDSEYRIEFRGKWWVDTIEEALNGLGKSFLRYIKEQGKTLDNIEEDELIRLISEYNLEKNQMLTKAFESNEEAEKETELLRKKIKDGYEDFTLIWSNSDHAVYRHNDFLSVQFNCIRFEPVRGYSNNYIRCYNSSNCQIGVIDDKDWSIWFNKIKTINSETFKEVVSMIEEPDPCFED